jgi:hypothetical protein
MLSDRLRQRTLFASREEALNSKRKEALDMLEGCTDNLVIAMKTIENLKLFPREDIEDYVISYIEAFEERYYTLDEDDFDTFLREFLGR